MEAIWGLMYGYVFVLGSCIASFMNVVIYRLPLGISVAKGRSFCPSCHHSLKAIDLVPFFSWLFLKRRCRYCGEKISVRYPLIELSGGLLAMVCFDHFGFSGMTIISFILAMTLLAIAMIDLDTMEIPDSLVFVCFLCAIVRVSLYNNTNIVSYIIGFFIISVPMFLLNCIVSDAFGGGDIKLISVCGLMLGWQNTLLAMFIAVILAGSYAGYLLISHQVERKGHIAFGPYICIGVFAALLYGDKMIRMYLKLFGL